MNFRKSLAWSRVVAIALAVAGGAALAEVDDLVRRALTRTQAGQSRQAYELLEPLKLRRASDRDFDTVVGIAANPIGAHARAMFAVGDSQSTRTVLQQAKEQGAPAQAGMTIDALLRAIDVAEAQMLARLPLVDLMVDAVRFNANQGLVDALRMGVPAVTCAGNSMASRLGGSILRAGNLEHAISSSPSDHLQQVIELVATDRGCKGCAPHWLEPGGVSPLFDTPLHVRQWEWAWDHMVQRHRGGFAPAAFDVPLATPWVMDNALPVDG